MNTSDSPHTVKPWRVDILSSEGSGREGTVIYTEGDRQLAFPWEISGGDSVASIRVGSEAEWQQHQPWAVAARALILQRVAAEAIRQKSPTSHAHVDEQTGWMDLRAAGAEPATTQRVAPAAPAALHMAMRARKARLSMALGGALLLAAAAAIGMQSLFTVKSGPGTPMGPSVRTHQHVATLISTLEPYVPSLHHNPDNDRYTVSLLLVPVDGRSGEQLIPITKGKRSGELTLARLLGGDGRTVWFNVAGVGGVDVASRKLIGPAELRRANPDLDESWDDYRRVDFDQRLRVTSPDRQRVYALDPATLRTEPVAAAKPRLPLTPDVQDFLSVGAHPAPDQWLALLSPQQAAREFRPGQRLSPVNAAESVKVMRRLHRAELGPVMDRDMRQIQSLTPLSTDEYFNAAFVRSANAGEPIRVAAPDSFLMAFNASPSLGATVVVARVDSSGKLLWRVDTGIERFKLSQILPGSPWVAFIGTRPPVPDKLSEPLLVRVNNETGALVTTSLWK